MVSHHPTACGASASFNRCNTIRCSTDFLWRQPRGRVKPQGWDSTTRYSKMGFGKDGLGVMVKEQTTFALGGLAGQTVAQANSAVALDKDFRILRTDMTAVLTGITSLEGAGLILYMTEGELTSAQVEANIELNGPLAMGDKDSEEIADRWVRRVAMSPNAAVNATERAMENKYGGHLIEVIPRWTFRRRRTASEGGWNWTMYNDGVTLTTGTICRILATHYGVWVG